MVRLQQWRDITALWATMHQRWFTFLFKAWLQGNYFLFVACSSSSLNYQLCSSIMYWIFYRLLIAALHFNENAGRDQAKNTRGELEYKIVFPKYKKGSYVIRKITTSCTYGMFRYLHTTIKRHMFTLFSHYFTMISWMNSFTLATAIFMICF